MTTDDSGYFTVTVDTLPAGDYYWRVKDPKYLAASGSVTLTGATASNAEMGLQLAGDCDDNNVISATDFSVLRNTYGKTVGEIGYDDRADFTGEQVVNVNDFALLRGNFNTGGAPGIHPRGP
jgi:hypothetical protein